MCHRFYDLFLYILLKWKFQLALVRINFNISISISYLQISIYQIWSVKKAIIIVKITIFTSKVDFILSQVLTDNI